MGKLLCCLVKGVSDCFGDHLTGEIFSVEPGNMGQGDFFGAFRLAFCFVSAVAKSSQVHGFDHFLHPALFFNFALREQGQVRKREYLSMSLAEELGRFLFSKKTGDELRGLAVSILRVRYETPEEYAGLLSAMRQTLSKEFSGSSKKGEAIIQFSEPFDGVERSFLITPLLARHVQERGYRAVSLVGRSPGPKSGLNLKDLYHALKGSFARHGSNLKKEKPAFGWALDQADFSKSLDQWVEKRWKTKKRPFLSTLEKIINPSGAEILVTSAFHPPYTEKMVACAEGAGFSAVIVFRRGIEGTLTLSPAREAEAICSVVDEKGEWHRTPFEFSYNSPSGARLSADKNIVAPTPAGNADWIYQYADKGMTKETQFDRQAVFSTAVLDKCLDWVEAGLEKKK